VKLKMTKLLPHISAFPRYSRVFHFVLTVSRHRLQLIRQTYFRHFQDDYRESRVLPEVSVEIQ